MEERDAKELLAKYNAGLCNDEEKALLESWYLQHQHRDPADLPEEERMADMDTVRASLLHEIGEERGRIRPFWRWTSAAAILMLTSSVCYYLLTKEKDTGPQTAQNNAHDIAPATNKAVLKTGHGKNYILSAQQNVQLVAGINKVSDEALTYSSATKNGLVVYDTLINPRGGRPIMVRLSDGSKVWLNAATTFIYPELFVGQQRQVELADGEMIFEVVHNEKQPFSVKAGKQLVEDLGTTFNISAYKDDDEAQTTLIEGSIRLTANAKTLTLKPGQAASVTDSDTELLKDVNVDGVIA
ncbi:FecR domain-containing protein [Mucilaginibacter sp. ZT4R22]|uniref:FecR domain-containing protein n=1 Tax=Mucilaginibacter pankratovii TaxID=2772110 RepID=A0ABR7WT54_9SPHI|nr:FecR family protein [Mucilaginibacter pankratovii]MBD1365373.1 FecR domain-containing protein [Mucilaginibacter pankratovii]